jgi:hypothetical protein
LLTVWTCLVFQDEFQTGIKRMKDMAMSDPLLTYKIHSDPDPGEFENRGLEYNSRNNQLQEHQL